MIKLLTQHNLSTAFYVYAIECKIVMIYYVNLEPYLATQAPFLVNPY